MNRLSLSGRYRKSLDLRVIVKGSAGMRRKQNDPALSWFPDNRGIEKGWSGNVVRWKFDRGPVFTLSAADGIYELNLPYPTRKCSRTMRP